MSKLFGKRRVYLDYASATPVLPEVLAAINAAEESYGNPAAPHAEGVAARKVLEDARTQCAAHFGVKGRQLVFTSGLTESNNLAILGYARKLNFAGPLARTHWVTTAIEHASILEPFAELERLGASVTRLAPDAHGRITPEVLKAALRDETVFVSIGWANSELGVVQDLAALSRVLRARGKRAPLFHADAGQAPLYRPPHLHTLGVDLMSVGAGKLYGPRTCGALIMRKPENHAPIMLGGEQETGLRPGTEKPAPAVGFAKALEIVARDRAAERKRMQTIRAELLKALKAAVPDMVLNGDLKHSLPHMLNISLPKVHAEYLLLALDAEGFALSTRSACESAAGVSHVVRALGDAPDMKRDERARNTLRISLGRENQAAELQRFARALAAQRPKASA